MESIKTQLPKRENQMTQEIEVRYEVSDIRIEQRSDNPDTGRTISGYAAKFDKWSVPLYGWFTELISRGAFDGCDMSDVIMCFNHAENTILARTISKTLLLEVDDIGLRFCFEAPNTTCGNDMVELVRRGDINQCSFRFAVSEDKWVYADDENGLERDQRTIIKFSKLYDTALVVHPAYTDTEVSVRHLEQRKNECFHSKDSDKKIGSDKSRQADTADCYLSRNRLCEMLSRANK